MRVTRVWRWWSAPFRTNVDIYERTRIEWRLFPPRLRVQALPASVQESIDAASSAGGGTVSLSPGRIHVVEPIDLTGRRGVTLQNMFFVGHGRSVIETRFDA